ncbi:MAG: histidine phosphatase family protein [Blastocatellia bacterium]|nr:histidine phosphatase family protein [Blastocatellia bacterium]
MKKLFILRHAKSSWDTPDISDFERPLNDRGLSTAPFMGELLAGKGIAPDKIISSPAKRALYTAMLIRESAGLNTEISYDDRVYEASPQTLRQVVSELPEGLGSVMLVGHNPGIEGLIRMLSGETHTMPTAAFAELSLNIEHWSEVAPDCGKLLQIIRPKDEQRAASLNLDL